MPTLAQRTVARRPRGRIARAKRVGAVGGAATQSPGSVTRGTNMETRRRTPFHRCRGAATANRRNTRLTRDRVNAPEEDVARWKDNSSHGRGNARGDRNKGENEEGRRRSSSAGERDSATRLRARSQRSRDRTGDEERSVEIYGFA